MQLLSGQERVLDMPPHVVDVATSDFQASVVEESRRRPVVVDFWASWCGPCRILGPILEKLAGEFSGAFLLAKIDTEANPELATQYRIQSIPNVKVFRDGELTDEFFGALPEDEVRSFLKRHCPSAADLKFETAVQELHAGRVEQAVDLLRQTLQEDPLHTPALFELGRALAIEGKTEEARQHWDRIPVSSDQWEQAQTMKRVLDFEAVCDSERSPADWAAFAAAQPENLEARYGHGCCLALEGEYRPALEEFLFVVSRDKSYNEQAARKAMLTIFTLAGERSELSEEFRKRLAQVLF
jgi:putative thioredoxin